MLYFSISDSRLVKKYFTSTSLNVPNLLNMGSGFLKLITGFFYMKNWDSTLHACLKAWVELCSKFITWFSNVIWWSTKECNHYFKMWFVSFFSCSSMNIGFLPNFHVLEKCLFILSWGIPILECWMSSQLPSMLPRQSGLHCCFNWLTLSDILLSSAFTGYKITSCTE
jgi:hypothetical protein